MNEDEILVSIVIPTYNMGQYIGNALESIGDQSYKNWEVLIVDDCGRDDGTLQAVSHFKAKHPGKRIEYFRFDVNLGVSAARNSASKIARGELLAFLDPDDWWLPGYLRAYITLYRSSSVELLSGPCFLATSYPLLDQSTICRQTSSEIEYYPFSLAARNFMQPSSTIVVREFFDSVGGFDETRDLQHIEDWDLWIRMAKAGARAAFLATPHSVYRRHETAATREYSRVIALKDRLVSKHNEWFINMHCELLTRLLTELESYRRRGLLVKGLLRIDEFLKRFLR